MKTVKILLIASAVVMLAAAGCSQGKKVEGISAAQVDSVSYIIGMNFGKSLQQGGLDVLDAKVIAQAIQDVFDNKTPRYELDEMQMQQMVRDFMQKCQEAQKSKNAEVGKKFLEENKKNAGVVELSDGLQYKIETEGTGVMPTAEDTVKVHYKGTLIDGRVFDSSYDRKEPIEFPLGSVIKGWTEGLQHVKEGSKVVLYIPSDLAYGDRQMPGSIIEPGSTLVFEVELLQVKKHVPAATTKEEKK